MNKSLETAIKNDEPYFKGKASVWKGRIIRKLSENSLPEAKDQILEGLEILTELGAKPDIAMGHFFLGELYAQNNGHEEAAIHLKKAEVLFKEMSMDYWLEETKKTYQNSKL